MAERKKIKERIRATEKTYQITNAMNMVSTSKLKKSEKNLTEFRPISDEINGIMNSLLSNNPELDHFAFKDNNSKPCYLIISSDRGLIGNYNNALFKYFIEYVNKRHQSKDEYMVATIGFKAHSFAMKNDFNLINKEAMNVRDDVLFADFDDVSHNILESYKNGSIGKTVVFYNSFVNTMMNEIKTYTLLPIEKPESNNSVKSEFVYEPDKNVILSYLVKYNLDYTIYRIILEAKTSEHSARMNAMKNASDNAKEIEEELTLLYNHARQNEITTELTDIINGSNAVN